MGPRSWPTRDQLLKMFREGAKWGDPGFFRGNGGICLVAPQGFLGRIWLPLLGGFFFSFFFELRGFLQILRVGNERIWVIQIQKVHPQNDMAISLLR